MSTEKVLPALPPLSAIQDPNTRAALQAIYTALQTGAQKWVTEADVGSAVTNVFTSAGSSSGAPGSVAPGGAIGHVIDVLSNYIINTPEWLALEQRIVLIGTREWMRDAMRQAMQDKFDEVRVLAARMGQAEAAVGYQDRALTSLERASVESYKAVAANFGANTAGVTDLATAVSTAFSAQASHIDQTYASVQTVDTKFYGAIEHADQVRVDLDGVTSAMYTLRVEANGHVAGMSIGAHSSMVDGELVNTSNIVFRSDTFAIGAPGAQSGGYRVPFMIYNVPTTVDGTTYPAGTAFLNNVVVASASIGDGAITNAKIGDVIQSDNYNAVAKTGWIIRKGGSGYMAEFYGDVLIDGTLTNDALQSGLSQTGAVVSGSVGLSGAARSATVAHSLGRPVIASLSNASYLAYDGGGSTTTATAVISSNGTTGFTINTPLEPVTPITVSYVYL